MKNKPETLSPEYIRTKLHYYCFFTVFNGVVAIILMCLSLILQCLNSASGGIFFAVGMIWLVLTWLSNVRKEHLQETGALMKHIHDLKKELATLSDVVGGKE